MDDLKKYEGWSKTKIVNAIRREFMTYRQKWVAIQRCVKRVELPDGRMQSLVECQSCRQLVERKNTNCHHRDEVGPLVSTAPADIKAYRERMFVPAYRLIPMCRDCHHQHHKN